MSVKYLKIIKQTKSWLTFCYHHVPVIVSETVHSSLGWKVPTGMLPTPANHAPSPQLPFISHWRRLYSFDRSWNFSLISMYVFLFIVKCKKGLFCMCNSIGSCDTHFLTKKSFCNTVLHILAVLKFHLFLNHYFKTLYPLLLWQIYIKPQIVKPNYLDNLFYI